MPADRKPATSLTAAAPLWHAFVASTPRKLAGRRSSSAPTGVVVRDASTRGPAGGPAPWTRDTRKEWFIDRHPARQARRPSTRTGCCTGASAAAGGSIRSKAELGPRAWRRRRRGLAAPRASRQRRRGPARLAHGLLLGRALVGRPAGRRVLPTQAEAQARPARPREAAQGPARAGQPSRPKAARSGWRRRRRPRHPATADTRLQRCGDAARDGDGGAGTASSAAHRHPAGSLRHMRSDLTPVDRPGDGPRHRGPRRHRPRPCSASPPAASCCCCSSPSCWPRPWRPAVGTHPRPRCRSGGARRSCRLPRLLRARHRAGLRRRAGRDPPGRGHRRVAAAVLRAGPGDGPATCGRPPSATSVTALIESVAGILKPPPPPDPDTVVEVGTVGRRGDRRAGHAADHRLLLARRARPAAALHPGLPAGGSARRGARRLERDREPAGPVGPRPAHPDGRDGRCATGIAYTLLGLPGALLLGPHRRAHRGHPDRRAAARRHPGRARRGHRVARAGRRRRRRLRRPAVPRGQRPRADRDAQHGRHLAAARARQPAHRRGGRRLRRGLPGGARSRPPSRSSCPACRPARPRSPRTRRPSRRPTRRRPRTTPRRCPTRRAPARTERQGRHAPVAPTLTTSGASAPRPSSPTLNTTIAADDEAEVARLVEERRPGSSCP